MSLVKYAPPAGARLRRAALSILSLAAFSGVLPPPAQAAVEVYPGPGVNTYQTDLYRVEVLTETRWIESYTYKVSRKSVTNWHRNAFPSVSFTTFGTTRAVTVRVSKLQGPITSFSIGPRSKNIAWALIGGQAYFNLIPNDKVWIDINGDDANPLFVFADAPKPPVPPGATLYGPGVHRIGLAKLTANGETIYLDGGAWVIGTIDLRGRQNVKIMGPGVLSGEFIPGEKLPSDKTTYRMIFGDSNNAAPKNNRLEDITIVNSPTYMVSNGPDYIGNVKLLSPWFYSTDGLQMMPGSTSKLSLIENCFVFNGDDIFFCGNNWRGNIEIRNCFVSTPNNSVFALGYKGNALNHNYRLYAHDIDIRNHLAARTEAIFKSSVNGAQDTGFKNMTFENIRIENDLPGRLLLIENREYFWPNQTTRPPTKLGNTSNMVFRNVSVAGKQGMKSTLLGLDAQNGHHDYLFENLRINGVTLTNSNASTYFDINAFTWNIRFSAAPNLAPTAISQSIITPIATAKTILLAGADPGGRIASYAYTQPAHGTVTGSGPMVIYTPIGTYTGFDSFAFKVRDNLNALSTQAGVGIMVVPRPPVANLATPR